MQAQEKLSRAVSDYKKSSESNYDQLAELWSVSKTTVHRAAKGDWKISTGHVEKIARKLKVDIHQKADVTECKILMSTLEEVWDGTPAHALALSTAIKGLHQMSLRHKL